MLRMDLIAGNNVAIHVSTAAKADMLIDALAANFPDRVNGFYRPGNSMIEEYERDTGFCLYPRFGQKRHMSYGKRGTYDDWGVPVVEFEELLVSDLVTNDCGLAIEFLFS